ncbi:MAG: hypothetical protein WBX15_10865 [Thermoanaerobaculia bacterium]
MRTRLVPLALVLLAFALSGCASHGVQQIHPEVDIAQVSTPVFQLEHAGYLSIQFELAVKNIREEPVVLKRVELRTTSDSPYVLRRQPTLFNRPIPPHVTDYVRFSVDAYSYGGRAAGDFPATVQGTAIFDSEEGTIRVPFQRLLRPASHQRD